jgi:beta-xylosidase
MKRTLTLILMLGLLTAAGAKKKQQTATVFDGYLFAYFEGGGDNNLQEQLRFAVSEDARNWYALNGNRPVVASDTISESGGIRDPHILRGEDGCYYIVATDMMVAKNGWNENPGIVMMKSKDLVNWTHGKVNLAKDWPAFSDAYWVWAPQTIYDRKAKKYMIYFTLQRTGDNRQSLITFYAYANQDFTAFESEPRQLFAAKYGSIDNDIIEKDGTYHLFYKGNTKDENGKEVKNGIQQAT